FPNLSALDNVGFGLRARGHGRAAARRIAAAWLERVGLTDHADHLPAALSGGQAQRVALARALAPSPRLVLLDEPLAALDAGTRRSVRGELREHLADFDGGCVLVTHDPVDAYALADHVVILEGGRVVQAGRLPDVAAHPRSRYVAELVGVNLLTGHANGGVLRLDGGGTLVTADAVDGPTFAVVAPHSIALYRRPPEGSPRNVWPGVIHDIDRRADRVRVQVGGTVPLVAEITAGSLETLELGVGDQVWASVKATDVTTSPA
ncbi:MAG: sulfate/molybdate ABC transporter ATP-binding protein, partial [Desertimonas sp.]